MWTAEDESNLQQASAQLDAARNAVATLDARRKAELLTPLGELLICVPSNAGLTGAALHGVKHAVAIMRLLGPLTQVPEQPAADAKYLRELAVDLRHDYGPGDGRLNEIADRIERGY